MKKPRICIVVAIGRDKKLNRVLGKDNNLLWRIPDDLKRFRALTTGHPIIFGRKTFESIGRVLPGRTNIVVTRGPSWTFPGAVVVRSLEEGIEKAKEIDQEEIHIGGGAHIYEQALPYVDKLYLTLIDDEKEGDTFFPAYEKEFTKKVFEEEREWNGIRYRWVDLERQE